MEALAAYKPDLVVISHFTDRLRPPAAALRHSGALPPRRPRIWPGLHRVRPDRPGDRAPGRLAESVRSASIKQPDRPHRRLHTHLGEGRSYYYELDQTYYSVTSATFIGQLLSLLGMKSIADSATGAAPSGGYPQLSPSSSSRPTRLRHPRRHGLLRPDACDRGQPPGWSALTPSRTAMSSRSTTTSPPGGARGSSTCCGRGQPPQQGRRPVKAAAPGPGVPSRTAVSGQPAARVLPREDVPASLEADGPLSRARRRAGRAGQPGLGRIPLVALLLAIAMAARSSRWRPGSWSGRPSLATVGEARWPGCPGTRRCRCRGRRAIVWQIRLPRVILGCSGRRDAGGRRGRLPGRVPQPAGRPVPARDRRRRGLGATVVSSAARSSIRAPGIAFAGAAAAVAITYALGSAGSRATGHRVSAAPSASIVLAGVAVAALLTAVQEYLQQQHAQELAADLHLGPGRTSRWRRGRTSR